LLLLEAANKSVNLRVLDVRGNFEDLDYTHKIVEFYRVRRPTTRMPQQVQEAIAIACLKSAERAMRKKELTSKETKWLSSTLMRVLSYAATPREVHYAPPGAAH
jgi:hypothetical protein